MTQQKHRYTGLTAAEVNQSRAQHGTNVLTPPEKEPLWKQFLEKFSDPLIIILLGDASPPGETASQPGEDAMSLSKTQKK